MLHMRARNALHMHQHPHPYPHACLRPRTYVYRHMHMHSCAFSHTHREVDRKRRDLLAAIRAAVDRKREHARLVREAEVVCM